MDSIPIDRLLSPRDLAEAIGMSESSLKRWADRGLLEVTRTAGGHRRITVKDAIKFIREKHLRILNPTAIGLPGISASGVEDIDDETQALLDHLVNGQIAEAWHFLMGRYLAGASIAELGDGPIRSVLKELGDRWDHDSDGIFIEHRATDLCVQVVQQMRHIASPNVPVFRATGGAVSNDPYLLPSMLVASVIAENGGDATNLGPNTPVDVLRIDSVNRPESERPDLVWISTSIVEDPELISRQITQFADECHEYGILLAVGGRDVDKLKLAARPGLSIHESLAGFGKVARMIAASRSK
ncbi:MAG: hypothetical protein CMJ39_06975 [Phycisphaerae bacterium]|nr:hypothetical protein [Phycisphaerae bacterium]